MHTHELPAGLAGRLPPSVAYPAIDRIGTIGDRRTAAMVASDGSLNWVCLPDFDGEPLFGALIDQQRGGFWRMGPAAAGFGTQTYRSGTAILATTWAGIDGILELTDAMAWPETDRAPGRGSARVIVRRLRSRKGPTEGTFQICPSSVFRTPAEVRPAPGGLVLHAGGRRLGLWTSHPVALADGAAVARFGLQAGEEFWAVLSLDEAPERWDLPRARNALAETVVSWRRWAKTLAYEGPRRRHVLRSAATFHLLSYAPSGALVAAPTTSLPERTGGDRNYDYRFTWTRDISVSLGVLAMLGDLASAERYMDWLAGLGSSGEMPLQVLYRVDGGLDATQREIADLAGYRNSRPVRFGNHAFKQRQFGCLGYFADCAHTYLERGGRWKDAHWALIRRLADYTAANWRKPDNGIWELEEPKHFVSSKVMSWVMLERAGQIAERSAASDGNRAEWRAAMADIRAEVMERGWSERRQAFRQHYDSDALDAAALLIPVMRFLPSDHPRVVATVERIATELTVDGLVYRFDPEKLPGLEGCLSEFEGAFLPCTFWLAATYAMMGRRDRAEAIMTRAEQIAGPLGLFAEEADPRSGTFLGNTPLLFSHAEYLKAVFALDARTGARPAK